MRVTVNIKLQIKLLIQRDTAVDNGSFIPVQNDNFAYVNQKHIKLVLQTDLCSCAALPLDVFVVGIDVWLACLRSVHTVFLWDIPISLQNQDLYAQVLVILKS